MSVFKGQGLFTIELDTKIDLSGATETKILYTKPNGVRGSWDANVVNQTKLSYLVPDNSVLSIVGIWKLQSFAKIGGKDGYGEIVSLEVKRSL